MPLALPSLIPDTKSETEGDRRSSEMVGEEGDISCKGGRTSLLPLLLMAVLPLTPVGPVSKLLSARGPLSPVSMPLVLVMLPRDSNSATMSPCSSSASSITGEGLEAAAAAAAAAEGVAFSPDGEEEEIERAEVVVPVCSCLGEPWAVVAPPLPLPMLPVEAPEGKEEELLKGRIFPSFLALAAAALARALAFFTSSASSTLRALSAFFSLAPRPSALHTPKQIFPFCIQGAHKNAATPQGAESAGTPAHSN